MIMNEPMERPWGRWVLLYDDGGRWVKEITVKPGHRLSLQRHQHRDEVWVCIAGSGLATIRNYPKTLKNGNQVFLERGKAVKVECFDDHRLENIGEEDLVVIEVALSSDGEPLTEEDIERFDDDYGREE